MGTLSSFARVTFYDHTADAQSKIISAGLENRTSALKMKS